MSKKEGSSSPTPGPSRTRMDDDDDNKGETNWLSELLSLPENRGACLVTPLAWCPHLDSARKGAEAMAADGEGSITPECPCADCGNVGENWVCLHCCEVRCSRYVNEHSLLHAASAEGHVLCLSLSDLSVWCYACEDYLGDDDDSVFAARNAMHRRKFGAEMPRRKKQEEEEGAPTIVMQ